MGTTVKRAHRTAWRRGMVRIGSKLNPLLQLLKDDNTIAWYDYEEGITSDENNLVSKWNDKLKTGRDLIQLTPESQPELSEGVVFNNKTMSTELFSNSYVTEIFLIIKINVWGSLDWITDGIDVNTGCLVMYGVSPKVRASNGMAGPEIAGLTVGEFGLVKIIFKSDNSNDSMLQINDGDALFGDFGPGYLRGIHFGSRADGAFVSNVTIKEAIYRRGVDKADNFKIIENYFSEKYNLPKDDNFYINWTSDIHAVAAVIDDPDAIGSGYNELKKYYTVGAKLRKFVDYTNSIETDLVAISGDLVNDSPDFDAFLSYMNQISGVRKEYTIGNHDLYQSTLSEAEAALGYGAKTAIAGSKFNQSFSLAKGNFSIRILMIDSTNGTDYAGTCDLDTRNFIESELLGCDDNIAMIFMHHGPHKYADTTPQFVEADALALETMLANVQSTKGVSFKMGCFFGHAHGNSSVVKYTNLSFDGYLCPALVDGVSKNFIRIIVSRRGFEFENVNAAYPYP